MPLAGGGGSLFVVLTKSYELVLEHDPESSYAYFSRLRACHVADVSHRACQARVIGSRAPQSIPRDGLREDIAATTGSAGIE